MPYPRFQRARAFMVKTRTTGNVSVASTSWGAVDTTLDVVLDAQNGDLIEAGVNGLWGDENNIGRLEVGCVVNGNIVAAFGPTYAVSSLGVPGWRCPPSVTFPISGSVWRSISGADLSGGFVTLRLLVRTETASPIKTLHASATVPLQFWAKNHGPQDPNATA